MSYPRTFPLYVLTIKDVHLCLTSYNEFPRLPAIALTAYARTEDRLRALWAGYQSHIAKPVELAELAAVMASLTHRNDQVAGME